jgi:prepilin signal peptidase PulO-like enzyme (type II secretory pathway)
MALGPILPLSNLSSLWLLAAFIILVLFSGAVYSLLYSFALLSTNVKNFKKQFSSQFSKHKNVLILSLFLSATLALLAIITNQLLFLAFPVIILLFPLLLIYSKSIEESCMIQELSPSKLTEGDWLYKDIQIGEKTIKATWQGLSKSEINLIKKSKKKVRIKQGIPFSPAFIIAFILVLIFENNILSWISR